VCGLFCSTVMRTFEERRILASHTDQILTVSLGLLFWLWIDVFMVQTRRAAYRSWA
jgi:hypothetical protein